MIAFDLYLFCYRIELLQEVVKKLNFRYYFVYDFPIPPNFLHIMKN